jgi:hypothetical protein
MKEATGLRLDALKEAAQDRKKWRKLVENDSELGTHECEMNSGEGNGKPLLDSDSCLENPLEDFQEF